MTSDPEPVTDVPSLGYGEPHYPFGARNIFITGGDPTVGGSSNDPALITDLANTNAFPFHVFALFQNTAASITPSNVGAPITTCAITPDLPTGLSFSSVDCSITGTPTATSPQKFYTVTASSAQGTSKTTFVLSVVAPPGKVMNVPKASYVFVKNQPITPIVTQMAGGAGVADCALNGGLPTGLSYSPGTCNIIGTPTSAGWTAYIFSVNAGTIQRNFLVPPNDVAGGAGYWDRFGSFLQLPITIVDPATQPLISYTGQYYGKAELKLGVPIYPITPTNLGASITSCASTPALPTGLTLSQTDCTISGTPTSYWEPTTYLIVAKHGTSKSNGLALDLSVGLAKPKSLTCQSSTLCVHPLMPVWSQSDRGLAQYLSDQGNNVGSPPTDQGWCGGVSGAAVLKTYFQEIQQYSTIQSTAWPAPFLANDTQFPFVLKSMQLVGTSIPGGGTPMPSTSLDSFLGHCGVTYDYFSPGLTSVFTNPTEYGHGMPLGWLAVSAVGGANPHALALNGVEGSYHKIFDPWGAVYNATITYGANGTAGRLSVINGSMYNQVESQDGGTAAITSLQWIKDYISVSGATSLYRCQ